MHCKSISCQKCHRILKGGSAHGPGLLLCKPSWLNAKKTLPFSAVLCRTFTVTLSLPGQGPQQMFSCPAHNGASRSHNICFEVNLQIHTLAITLTAISGCYNHVEDLSGLMYWQSKTCIHKKPANSFILIILKWLCLVETANKHLFAILSCILCFCGIQAER